MRSGLPEAASRLLLIDLGIDLHFSFPSAIVERLNYQQSEIV